MENLRNTLSSRHSRSRFSLVTLIAGFICHPAKSKGDTSPSQVNLRSDARAYEFPSWMTERRIIGSNNLEQVVSNNVLEFYDYSRVVARLETPDGLGFCSGSRVGENLFLTNFHCVETVDCTDILIHMGYEKGKDKNQQGLFRCEEVLASNETHDYALIQGQWVGTQLDLELVHGSKLESNLAPPSLPSHSVEPAATAQDFPIAPLFVGSLSKEIPVVVPSHPRGRLKEIDKSADCQILSTDMIEVSLRETMTHSCDTEGGSSGSPVISRTTGAIVGLHWGGKDNQNFMVPVSAIVADLQKLVDKSILDQLQIVE